MLSTTKTRIAVVLAVLGIGGAVALPAAMAHHHHHGIPQHNGGDHDSDNRGGPSDGDGAR